MPVASHLMFQNVTTLKDTLYNLHPKSGATLDYCTGLVVGVVGAMMAHGKTFNEAIDAVACYMPHDYGTRLAVPDGWQDPLRAALMSRKIQLSNTSQAFIMGSMYGG